VDKLAETEVNTYALVISAGGDGTLLQTARYVGDISLLGVNTDARPGGSIGFLCATTAQDFSTFYDQYLNGLVDTISLGRLQATWKRGNETQSYFAINDVKIENITGSSTRYSMMINNEEERHMSSFSLVCSALGYTGEMIQIGGEPMELQSKEMQFKVIGSDAREISYGWCMIPAGTPITFRSRMNEGKLLIDGRVHVVDFNYGDLLTVEMDEHPLYLVGFNQKQREDVIQESYGKQKTLLRLKYE